MNKTTTTAMDNEGDGGKVSLSVPLVGALPWFCWFSRANCRSERSDLAGTDGGRPALWNE